MDSADDPDSHAKTLVASAKTVTQVVRLDVSLPPAASDAERYEVRDLLGEGGMGEVRLCGDRRIGREVALKVIRESEASRVDAVARFEREARVQGQLEHPSIVPVYDLGVDPTGRSFFTMKRLRGRTLRSVLDGLRAGDAALESEFTMRRLLSAFNELCWAITFSHSRGVIHRDVKPENVMFGDFGEVHLLDWGVATVVDDLRATSEPGARGVVDAALAAPHKTMMGEMVGTPGYMSPEQIEADPDKIDERLDVFALGAVLFEILTLEPLVDAPSTPELLRSTVAGVDARAAIRAPGRDVPPELEMACIRATAPLADRYRTARELRDAVERYLDGDRDLEKRRELARQRIEKAEALLAATPRDDARAEALRELAAAISLDPTDRRAQMLLGRLLIEGPQEMPEAARRELEAQRQTKRSALRRTLVFIAFAFILGPLSALLLGVRNWTWFAVFAAACGLVPATALYSWKRYDDALSPVLLMAVAMFALATGSMILGPVINSPAQIVSVAVIFLALSRPRIRPFAFVFGIAAIVGPFVLQWTGVVSASYVFIDGEMHIRPIATDIEEPGSLVYMVTMALIALGLASIVVLRRQALVERLEERLFLHAWTLQELVPREVGVSMPRGSDPPPPGGSLVKARSSPAGGS